MQSFIFTDTATTEIYTLSLHDALPISCIARAFSTQTRPMERSSSGRTATSTKTPASTWLVTARSEEHTSELQSPYDLVCRLLLEKKNKKRTIQHIHYTLC